MSVNKVTVEYVLAEVQGLCLVQKEQQVWLCSGSKHTHLESLELLGNSGVFPPELTKL